MKKLFISIIFFMFLTLAGKAEPVKVMQLSYDNNSSSVFINTERTQPSELGTIKYTRLENPNRIYFDIEEGILIGQKQHLIFDNSPIKEVRLAQFSTNPNIVRAVLTFDETFDVSKVKLINLNSCIVVNISNPKINNDYFNTVYDEQPESTEYSNIIVNSQAVHKIEIPKISASENADSKAVVQNIQQAFASSTLQNSDGNSYDSVVSVDVSSGLKLRTKYFINGYSVKNDGFLVSGIGQITASKMFTLDSPKRLVIDLPNTFVDKKIRNKELNLCANNSCKDTAKIGQFERNIARIVITTDNVNKYIPIYSTDSQSLLLINADKLNHTSLASSVSNIQQVFVKKINSKTNELILSFTNSVVHSILRDNNMLTIYMFNVKSYNEPELIKVLNNSYYKKFTLSLLPQIGVKAELKINKDDIIQISQGIDGKAIKLTVSQATNKSNDDTQKEIITPKIPIKNKIVIDPGHGGSDYGAIREGINEKDITIDISQRIASILKSKGYKVALTRTEDIYLGLQERCDFTEIENPEIFVSIHVNSAVATEPYGIETHYYHEESKELADVIQEHLMKNIETKNRGVIKSKFYVINHTDVPAVLVETGFISNPEERADLITDKRKQTAAKAIADGIIEYLKKKK